VGSRGERGEGRGERGEGQLRRGRPVENSIWTQSGSRMMSCTVLLLYVVVLTYRTGVGAPWSKSIGHRIQNLGDQPAQDLQALLRAAAMYRSADRWKQLSSCEKPAPVPRSRSLHRYDWIRAALSEIIVLYGRSQPMEAACCVARDHLLHRTPESNRLQSTVLYLL
jgi:hypothetical protein